MKHRLSLFATLLLAITLPQSVKAYSFSAVAPTGQTLYYNINGSEVSVTYPGSVSESLHDAYDGFTSPSGSLEIPSSVTFNGTTYSVTSIGDYAFFGCSGLSSVTISNSVTSIGHAAFFGCSGLSSMTIPNSITSISDSMFYSCSNLSSMDIPNSITSIGGSAFTRCSSLSSVTIPNSVTEIGEAAFSDCSGIISVTISNSVTEISNGLFFGCSRLTSMTIPNSVTTIRIDAFSGCSSLTSVIIPNSVTEICFGAFYQCSSLFSVTIPNSVTSIGNCAFYSCSGLTSVTIGDSVSEIGKSAFWACTRLASVTIPNSVTSIGEEAFLNVRHIEYHGAATGAPWGAISMNGIVDSDFVFSNNAEDTLLAYIGVESTVVIPNTVTFIGGKAFYNCRDLTSVTIPNSVITIGKNAFRDCRSLTTLNLGNAVYSIGDKAFFNCYNITKITSWNETPPILGSECFIVSNTNIPVFVPCDAISLYRAASGWNEFSNYKCPPVGIDEVNNEVDNVTIYQRDGRIVIKSGDNMPLGEVSVYDAVGRQIARPAACQMPAYQFDVPATGTYLVKVGDFPARKVVVIR